MLTGMYDGLIRRLSERMEAALGEIESEHNFELGDEFEVALCKVLRSALPTSLGVCRGYVVARDGRKAGDDIIIYDSSRFTTLRARAEDSYGTLERVPVEAVLAYIEAKHALEIEGESGQSFSKAIAQVTAVKELLNTREPVPVGTIVSGVGAKHHVIMKPAGTDDAIDRQNPAFAVVFARHVRVRRGKPVLNDGSSVLESLGDVRSPRNGPDVIVAGNGLIIIPAEPVNGGPDKTTSRPFLHPVHGLLSPVVVPNSAFGIGLGFILWALDSIKLGSMPWPPILAEATGLPEI